MPSTAAFSCATNRIEASREDWKSITSSKAKAKAKTVQVYYSDLEMGSLEDAYHSLKNQPKATASPVGGNHVHERNSADIRNTRNNSDIGPSTIG